MSKYNNTKVEIDGVKFDSKLEARYYVHLLELQKKGIVQEFLMQKQYIIFEGYDKDGKKVRPIKYIADFEVHYAAGFVEVIDVKGMITKDFAIKKKLFEYRYPFKLILLTYSRIDGGWITLDDLSKRRAARKKAKAEIK